MKAGKQWISKQYRNLRSYLHVQYPAEISILFDFQREVSFQHYKIIPILIALLFRWVVSCVSKTDKNESSLEPKHFC